MLGAAAAVRASPRPLPDAPPRRHARVRPLLPQAARVHPPRLAGQVRRSQVSTNLETKRVRLFGNGRIWEGTWFRKSNSSWYFKPQTNQYVTREFYCQDARVQRGPAGRAVRDPVQRVGFLPPHAGPGRSEAPHKTAVAPLETGVCGTFCFATRSLGTHARVFTAGLFDAPEWQGMKQLQKGVRKCLNEMLEGNRLVRT